MNRLVSFSKVITRWARSVARHVGHWRLARLGLASLLLFSVLLPAINMVQDVKSYALSPAAEQVIGQANDNLSAKFTYDIQNNQWQFNKSGSALQASAIAQAQGGGSAASGVAGALAQLKAKSQVGGGGKNDQSLYSVNLPVDATKGVSYYDNNTQLSFTMTPQFKLMNGKKWQGRIVYPLAGGGQLVYTAKNNGLKEDIVLDHAKGDKLAYDYKLNLPDTLEARMMDDGSVGVYSADPSLFGNISYGDASDQAKIMAARKSAAKDNLVFAIPAPVIKDKNGQAGQASFSLSGDQLTVTASGLSQLSYPLSVDPSVVVTSTSDFTSGNNEDMIDYGTNGQVGRASVSGGSVSGGWTTSGSTPFASTRWGVGSAAYNGNLYVVGGSTTGSVTNTVYYAAIGSGGSVGNWSAAASLPVSIFYPNVAAYNGYLYVYGGYASGTAALSAVQYAKVNGDGSLGNWTTSSNAMATAVCRSGAAVYKGYLYALGGSSSPTTDCANTSAGQLNTVQYAPLLANGDVGTWSTSSNAFANARLDPGTFAYNGYLYTIDGTQTGSGGFKDTQYAPILANGNVGTWTTSTILTPTANYRFGMSATNGYVYMVGGDGGTGASVRYAQLNANGAIGAWQDSVSLPSSNEGLGFQVYNGYLYTLGGNTSTGLSNATLYAKIDPPGVTGGYANTASFSNARFGHTSVAYNGYLYVIGGYGSGGYLKDVQYAPINADGTVGTWATTASFTTARRYQTSVAYNGYLYVIGGYNGSYLKDVQYAPINPNGTVGTWATTTSFTTARYGHTSVVYNGYLYVMGGYGGSLYNDVQYAPINPNGTVGTWATTTSFTGTRTDQTSVVAGGYLYVLGGFDGSSNYYSDVQYAAINANGTVGSWTATTAISGARAKFTAVVYNDNLYIIGGEGSSNYYSDVQYAPINANGSISSWQSTTGLSTGLRYLRAVSYNGYLYVVGGEDSSDNVYNNVQYAQTNNGGSGTAGAWGTTTSFTTARYYHTTVAYNGYLYVIGGAASSSHLSDVQYAPLNADGTVGTWTATTSLAAVRYEHTSVAYNGYLYVIGGFGNTVNLNTVQYAPLNADGTVGTWTATTSFTTARFGHTSVAYNGYLYVIGGYSNTLHNDLNDVQYAVINPDGTLGAWATTSSFTTVRDSHTSVAYNGYLYVIGGYNDTPSYLSDVQYAPINANGTIGTWVSTTSLTTARYSHTSVAYNGYLYVIGGKGSGGNLSDVQYAPINANGTIGTWVSTTSLTTARYSHTSVAYNGYLYVVGGYNNTTYYNDVQYSPLNVITRTSHYSKLIDLGTSSTLQSIAYNGTLPGGKGAIQYRTASDNGIFGTTQSATSLPGGDGSGVGPCTVTGSGARYVWLLVTLDDSQNGVFPDSASNFASLTDLTLSYQANLGHPAPSVRLHNGKYFQSGNLQPLDTCGA